MSRDDEPDEEDYSLMILKNRLAKGEITIEEFDKLKEKLAQASQPESAGKEIASVKEKVDKLQKEQLEIQRKSMSVTLTLSVLCGLIGILGIGHFYTASNKRGIAFLLPGLFLVLVILLLVFSPTILPQNPGFEQFQQKIVVYYFTILYGLVYLGLYFVQIFDARRSCRRYNLLLTKTNSLKGQQIASNRSRTTLAVVLGILVIIGAVTANDLSQNIPKLRSLQQEQQTADQEKQNSQTLAGYSQAYEKWRACSQKAGSVYLSVCGNPPQSPFDTEPIDCSLSVNHWLCNPYYTENSGTKSSTTKSSTTNSAISQTPQIIQASPTSHPSGATAIISTKFGNLVIKLRDDVAPKTVANFEKLANSGFYDGTIFHTIVPGYVILGGDPNTKSGSRNTWGTGDAGYTITPEFSNLKHTKYMVSMYHGSDINSASSQFFIVLGDAPWLDGKYTIFGEVISGQVAVDKIAAIKTDRTTNQPTDPDSARIVKIVIQ